MRRLFATRLSPSPIGGRSLVPALFSKLLLVLFVALSLAALAGCDLGGATAPPPPPAAPDRPARPAHRAAGQPDAATPDADARAAHPHAARPERSRHRCLQ